MIQATKLERNIFRVKPIQNQSHHINIAMSTQRIQSVIVKPSVSMVMFAVLVSTPISSSLFHHSQSAEFSRYEVNLALTIFDTKNVRTITIPAKMRFNSNSVEKKLNIKFVFAFHCSNSFAHAENVDGDQKTA
jgi:hypothetical protein